MAQSKQTAVPIENISGGRNFGTPSQVLKASGAEASQIKKVKKQEVAKPLSKAMQQWVKANRSKLKDPTDKQKAIFNKYDQMKKAGMLAAKPAAKKASTTTKVTKKVASTTPAAPKKDTPTKPQSKTGVHGKPLPPNPQLKSQPKPETKAKRRRGSGVKKTGKKVNLGKALQNLSDKFKLTRKAGEVFTVGNMRYVSDGKGGIRSSQRIR